MGITTMLRNMRETGYPFAFRQRNAFLENIWELAPADLTMTASTALCLPLHKMYAKSPGVLQWKRAGIYIQSAFQATWLLYWVA